MRDQALVSRMAELLEDGAKAEIRGSTVVVKWRDCAWHVACATPERAKDLLERANRIAARPLAA